MSLNPEPQAQKSATALEKLVNREDVLQICYWFQGEGFGSIYRASDLETFLNCDAASIVAALTELVSEGHLQETSGPPQGYEFTDKGKKQGGKMFGETFADFSRQGHGECPDGCCDGDDHSQCGDSCFLH